MKSHYLMIRIRTATINYSYSIVSMYPLFLSQTVHVSLFFLTVVNLRKSLCAPNHCNNTQDSPKTTMYVLPVCKSRWMSCAAAASQAAWRLCHRRLPYLSSERNSLSYMYGQFSNPLQALDPKKSSRPFLRHYIES